MINSTNPATGVIVARYEEDTEAVYDPLGVVHRFRNLSATGPMKILWIYARTDATRTLRGSGETRLVAMEHGKK